MMKLDLRTDLQQPIAWIDEAGKCFFPEIFSDDDELYAYCHRDFEKDKERLLSKPGGYQDIRLQLEIELNGLDCCKFKEYSGESNVLVKKIQVDGKPTSGHCDVEVDDDCVRVFDTKANAPILGNPHKGENLLANFDAMHGEMDTNAVKIIFALGMGSFNGADINDLCRGLSTFCKLDWSCSRSRTLWNTKSIYGFGVHLSPANCSINSARNCDVDECGVRYMLFCRVVMGNMELVAAGSKQCHLSSEKFGSGVDDLQNPTNYIIWDMNTDTHIYPGYVVSFKVSSDSEGFLVGNPSKLESSRLDLNLTEAQLVSAALGSRYKRSPKSPWLRF
ncbi:hypothetical protein Vadar_016323 [Vaccinium darrowii]|uniref:Uncharacterized protein n=1 Tax=Vaccinium darrowii TaxID=229202 RepID=A0ACB7XZI6_9ERIC|nr:hypothetical protein Vadar_016323 [Vaccinium darrowii]